MRNRTDAYRSEILYEASFSGVRLITLSKTDSTQDVAKDLARKGEPAWTAVMSLEQTRGRGRCGHAWLSPVGKNLAISVIMRPSIPAGSAPLLSLLAAITVANVLESKGVSNVKLKWPNDVLVENRKIAGILLEANIIRGVLREVILGLGLNINSVKDDFPDGFAIPPISYLMCTGQGWDLKEAAQMFLTELKATYERMEAEGFVYLRDQWTAKWAHKDQLVTYDGQTGKAIGISNDGFLILQRGDGSLVTVMSGEVLPIGALSSTSAQQEPSGKRVLEH